MYKLLLCWRYLRTRYLALVCIVSVLLGVGTLIVVNSVMAGFSTKLRDRLHGALSDLLIQSDDYQGFADPEGKMRLIRADPELASRIVAMTPTVEIFAMIRFKLGDAPIIRVVRLVGVDPDGRAALGGFKEHLVDPADQQRPSFDLNAEALARYKERHDVAAAPRLQPIWDENGLPPPDPPPSPPIAVPMGAFLGYAIAHVRDPESTPEHPKPDIQILNPGDDVVLTTITDGEVRPVSYRYVVTDYYRSEMSEYDSQYVFVPIQHLQRLRNMGDRATAIQIRLKDFDRDAKFVKGRLQKLFSIEGIQVQTWEDLQGPLLAAINVERGILNVLLFMIIGVAGFGILAIFSMIVVEKTRDIGVLKALGASNGGVLKIFLGYGLLLGLVGAGLGTALGVTITTYINPIEHGLALLTGHEIFDRNIYYFDTIPTDLQPLTVLLVNVGAVGIAVLFSVLPALRAAMLHPVRALRYE